MTRHLPESLLGKNQMFCGRPAAEKDKVVSKCILYSLFVFIDTDLAHTFICLSVIDQKYRFA